MKAAIYQGKQRFQVKGTARPQARARARSR